MTCIDFSSVLYDGLHYPKGARHVPRPNCLFADHGPLAGTPFQSMRQSLSRRSSYSNLYLSRSVLLHEFCPTNRSREFARHRGMPSCCWSQTLPRRREGKSVAYYPGQSKRTTRLENLLRYRHGSDQSRAHALCPSTSGNESQAGSVCSL